LEAWRKEEGLMEAWRQLSSRQLSLEELLALEQGPHLFAK
jgi:hypothetical protein